MNRKSFFKSLATLVFAPSILGEICGGRKSYFDSKPLTSGSIEYDRNRPFYEIGEQYRNNPPEWAKYYKKTITGSFYDEEGSVIFRFDPNGKWKTIRQYTYNKKH